MAVAWTATKLGRATVDVTVRDPVVLTATLPRFLLNGDHGTLNFDLDNVEGAPGDYTINVKASGPVKVSGNPATTIKLAAKQRSSMSLALDAGGAGTASLDVDIKGPDGLTWRGITRSTSNRRRRSWRGARSGPWQKARA